MDNKPFSINHRATDFRAAALPLKEFLRKVDALVPTDAEVGHFTADTQLLSIAAATMESLGSRLCVVVFYWRLNAMRDAKTRKLRSLRKESDKAKINLLSFSCLACDSDLQGTSGKARVFQKRKHSGRGVSRCSEKLLHGLVEVG